MILKLKNQSLKRHPVNAFTFRLKLAKQSMSYLLVQLILWIKLNRCPVKNFPFEQLL